MVFHFRKKDPTTTNSLKTMLFFENVDNSQTVLFKTSKFEWRPDNIRIENIILAPIWATIFCGGFGSTRC